LPLALKGELTYRVPFDMQADVKVGQRAIVQLGKKKLYSGIISEIHNRVPTKYQGQWLNLGRLNFGGGFLDIIYVN